MSSYKSSHRIRGERIESIIKTKHTRARARRERHKGLRDSLFHDMLLDMAFETIQVCRTTDGWSPIRVPSSSGDGNHLVLVNPHVQVKEFVCDCRGFEFRGYCSHQSKALDLVCWWPLGLHRQAQDELQVRMGECPQCGGPTRLEVVSAEEA